MPAGRCVGGSASRRDVGRAGDVDLVDALAADGAGAGRIVDADAAVVALEHQELVSLMATIAESADVAPLPRIGGASRRPA